MYKWELITDGATLAQKSFCSDDVFCLEKLDQFTARNCFIDLNLISTTALFTGVTKHKGVCAFISGDCN